MTATTIDTTQSSAAKGSLSSTFGSSILAGIVLVLAMGALLGLVSFLLGLGNIISGMLGAMGGLAIVWFGAKCIAKESASTA
jgi:succinate dehydrogenase/fumarate reductase cytochrome b subunit